MTNSSTKLRAYAEALRRRVPKPDLFLVAEGLERIADEVAVLERSETRHLATNYLIPPAQPVVEKDPALETKSSLAETFEPFMKRLWPKTDKKDAE
jgi:hypothetical protein